jgi:hypothetical protein
MAWINTDVNFNTPMARLVLPFCYPLANTLQRMLSKHGPEFIEQALLSIIAKCRPELAGGIVCGLSANIWQVRFEILYLHPSLPRAKMGETSQEMPLADAVLLNTRDLTFCDLVECMPEEPTQADWDATINKTLKESCQSMARAETQRIVQEARERDARRLQTVRESAQEPEVDTPHVIPEARDYPRRMGTARRVD